MAGRATGLVALAALVALGACDAPGPPDGADASDAGADVPASDAGLDVPTPAPPALRDWECPEGWLAEPVDGGGRWSLSVCAPPPRVPCPDPASFQLPGDEACRPLGTPCPEGGDLPDEQTVRGLAPGWDGAVLPARPGELSRVLAGAEPGAVVVLAPGRYEGTITLRRRVALVGSCVERTLVVGASGALVANLTLTGGGPGLKVDRAGRPVDVSRVRFEGLSGSALWFLEGSAGGTVTDVVVAGTRRGSWVQGTGIQVDCSCLVTVERTVVQDTQDVGLVAYGRDGAPRVRAHRVAVLRTASETDRSGGGIVVVWSGEVELEQVLVEQSRLVGIAALREDGAGPLAIDLTDVVVRDNTRVPRPAGDEGGWGLEAGGGAEISGRRLLLDHVRHTGFTILTGGDHGTTRVALDDVVIRETEALPNGTTRWGVGASGLSHLELTRAVLLGNTEIGVFAGGEGGVAPAMDLTDLVIADTRSNGALQGGRGVEVSAGTQLTVRRGLVDGNRDYGLFVFGWGGAPETRVVLNDVTVTHTAAAPCGRVPEGEPTSCVSSGQPLSAGNGVGAAVGARLTLDGFRISDSELAGLLVAREARVQARRGVITDNVLGVNVLVPDLDADAWEDVLIYGNETDVARVDMPVPEVASTLETR